MSQIEAAELQTDSLAKGIGVLAIANVLQRAIGFFRNLAFCYFLSQSDVGLWALASSFLILAAPLAVLGIPGSFGKYVEAFRQRGQLYSFLTRSLLASSIGVAILATSLLVFPGSSAHLIFGSEVPYSSIAILTAALLAVIAFNTLLELLNGLRQPSAVSAMQLVSSIGFSIIVVPVLLWRPTWESLVACYTIATIAGLIPGVVRLRRRCASAFTDRGQIDRKTLVFRVAPFALTVWSTDLLTNLFDIVDRYMLLHYASGDKIFNQSLVGEFHTARILPVLFLSLAGMLAGIILPYWSCDWEAGRKVKVAQSLLSTIKFAVLIFWAGSIVVLIGSPFLFDVVFEGRYAISQQALPLAMVHCILAAVTLLLGSFLRCIEANRWAILILGAALGINIAANWVAVPVFGVAGAMSATVVSTAIIVVASLAVIGSSIRLSDRGLFWILVLPLSLLISPAFSLSLFVIAIFVAGRTDWLINGVQRREIDTAFVPIMRRLGVQTSTIWPQHKLGVAGGRV